MAFKILETTLEKMVERTLVERTFVHWTSFYCFVLYTVCFALCVVINHRWVGLDAWATKPAALTPAHPHNHHHHHPLSFLR